jgi:hypothetical protein
VARQALAARGIEIDDLVAETGMSEAEAIAILDAKGKQPAPVDAEPIPSVSELLGGAL